MWYIFMYTSLYCIVFVVVLMLMVLYSSPSPRSHIKRQRIRKCALFFTSQYPSQVYFCLDFGGHKYNFLTNYLQEYQQQLIFRLFHQDTLD